jgi:DNA-directed RNA polymerase subunit RPC12/RpoP
VLADDFADAVEDAQKREGVAMAIHVKCQTCGKELNARDEHAGKQAKCPNCGDPIFVPRRIESPPEIQPGSGQSALRVGVCRDCGGKVSPSAKACPHCGSRTFNTSRAFAQSAAAIGCLIFSLLFIGPCAVIAMRDGPARAGNKPKAPFADRSPALQAQRKALIEKLIANGVFQKFEKHDNGFAHVWVTPVFMALDFDDKQSFISVVAAYASDEGYVTVKDSKTNKRIGSFDLVSGLSL